MSTEQSFLATLKDLGQQLSDLDRQHRLQDTLESIEQQISSIVQRPLMYVGGPQYLHTAEVMVRLLLHIWDNAMGYPGVDHAKVRTYLHQRYPSVAGPVRSVATGSQQQDLDFSSELFAYVSWYKEQSALPTAESSEVEVPRDLGEAVSLLQQQGAMSELEHWRKLPLSEALAEAHSGIGRWVRNNWGFWEKGPLHVFLEENFGLEHPDDMSGLLLHCLWKELNGEPWGVQAYCDEVATYWASQNSESG